MAGNIVRGVRMVDVFSAFKEAFAAFAKNLPGCLLRTIIFGFCVGVSMMLLLALVFVFSLLAVGGNASVALSGNISALALLSGSLLALFLGIATISWLLSGLVASYYDSLYSILSGKKQSLAGFFTSIPKKAIPLLLAQFMQWLIIALPVSAILIAASVAGAGNEALWFSSLGIANIYSAIIGFFTVFLVASVVLDNKGAVGAVSNTFSRVGRNMLPTAIYMLIGALLSFPMILAMGIPVAASMVVKQDILVNSLLALGALFSLAYAFLFYLPFIALANMSLYRKLR